ncbi:MAG: hypothetical protein EHM87_23330 [Burkholderiales bacterium]|nr:MAG: hypothetical protein EHM87_23330 [Burkholderiales bacterium]
MPDFDAINITKFYERQHVQKLLAANKETSAIFGRYIKRVTPIIQQYRYNKKGIVIRDPGLEKIITNETAKLKSELEQYINAAKIDGWMLSEAKNNRIIDEWVDQMAASRIESGTKWNEKAQQMFETGGMHQRNIQAMEQFMARKVSVMSLSDNVWKLAKNTKEQLEYYIESGLATGRSADVISRDIRQVLKDPDSRFRRVRNAAGKLVPSQPMADYHPGQGVYRSAYQNARRLARTEINMAYRSADMESFRNADMVLGYEVRLSNNHTAKDYDICDEAAGRYPKEFTFIGWHPNCRCYVVPILMTPEEFMAWNRGDAVSAQYQNDVPEGLKTWLNDHREEMAGWNKQPYFIQQNKGIVQRIYDGKKVIPVTKYVKQVNTFTPFAETYSMK